DFSSLPQAPWPRPRGRAPAWRRAAATRAVHSPLPTRCPSWDRANATPCSFKGSGSAISTMTMVARRVVMGPSESGMNRGLSTASILDDRQHDVRRPPAIVVDRVVGRDHPAVGVEGVASVRVDVEAGVVAARNVEPDAVAALEDVRGRVQGDRDRVD